MAWSSPAGCCRGASQACEAASRLRCGEAARGAAEADAAAEETNGLDSARHLLRSVRLVSALLPLAFRPSVKDGQEATEEVMLAG